MVYRYGIYRSVLSQGLNNGFNQKFVQKVCLNYQAAIQKNFKKISRAVSAIEKVPIFNAKPQSIKKLYGIISHRQLIELFYSLIQAVLFKLYQIFYLTSKKIKYKLPISDIPEECVELDKNILFILFNESSEFLFE